jgi:hypothetical protein
MRIETRYLAVTVALIENVGDRAIDIGKVAVKKSGRAGLRTPEVNSKILEDAPPKLSTPFSPRKLLPKEAIIYPLSIELLSNEQTSEIIFHGKPAQEGPSAIKALEALRHEPDENLEEVDGPIGDIMINVEGVEWSVQSPNIEESLVLGPAYKIETIEIDGKHFEFRAMDGERFAFQEFAIGFSCPFVYADFLEGEKKPRAYPGRARRARERGD